VNNVKFLFKVGLHIGAVLYGAAFVGCIVWFLLSLASVPAFITVALSLTAATLMAIASWGALRGS
jgi:hypothetical protein